MTTTADTGAATDLGGVPEQVRRIGWRCWMVARVPVYLVVFPFFAVVALVVMIAAVWMFGVVAFASGMFVGGVIELALLMVGVELGGSLATAFGFVALIGAGLTWLVSTAIDLVTSTRRNPYSPRERAALWVDAKLEGLAEEWRDAGDRWPARRRAIALREVEARHAQLLATRPPPSSPAAPAPMASPRPLPDPAPVVHSNQPIVAWRLWTIGPHPHLGDDPYLQSLTAGSGWEGPTLEARCTPLDHQRPVGDHTRLPVPACTCGIYSSKTRLITRVGYRSGILAQGRIELSGRVLEGERGYRAERATIVGPVDVSLTCDWSGTGGSCRRPATTVTLAASGIPEYRVTCTIHAENRRAQVIPEFTLMLQSRLELRYGVSAVIKTQGGG